MEEDDTLMRVEVIRVFELERTHRIDQGFWQRVARQQSQRGKAYRQKFVFVRLAPSFKLALTLLDRCNARAAPRTKSKGVHVCGPMKFPVWDKDVSDSIVISTPVDVQDFSVESIETLEYSLDVGRLPHFPRGC